MSTGKSRLLDYLPAIYQDPGYPGLGQFLTPFDDVLRGFSDLLAEIDRYFDPARTDADFLPWLATWVALALDEQWDEAKRRQLIAEAVELYRWRGTIKGLKRYLKIYTGLEPEIREWRWPGGLQVGVASQVGGTEPDGSSLSCIAQMARREPSIYNNYYVVEVQGAAPRSLFYRADRVDRVDVGDSTVDIWWLPDGDGPATRIHHDPATITRRDGLIDELYTLSVGVRAQGACGGPYTEIQFAGDTFLVDEIAEERPYRFIVDVRVPVAELSRVQWDKVRAILDLEKPAHTVYYLKLTPVLSEFVLQPLQVEVRSHVELDTTVG